MFPVANSQLPENKARPLSTEELAARREAARARHAEREASSDKSEAAGAVQLTGRWHDYFMIGKIVISWSKRPTTFSAFLKYVGGCSLQLIAVFPILNKVVVVVWFSVPQATDLSKDINTIGGADQIFKTVYYTKI